MSVCLSVGERLVGASLGGLMWSVSQSICWSVGSSVWGIFWCGLADGSLGESFGVMVIGSISGSFGGLVSG